MTPPRVRGRPPRLARRLLGRRLPGSLGEALAGDLEEAWRRDVARRGRLRADVRYWREVLDPAVSTVAREGRSLDPVPGASVRSVAGEGLVGGVTRDVAYAVRILARSPIFTVVAVLSLALAIGPNTAVYSLVDAVLLRGPEGREPERLADLYLRSDDDRWFYTGYWDVERVREGTADVFEGVAGWVVLDASVDAGGVPAPVLFELVTGNYFDVLGLEPARGRFFRPEEDATPGTHPVTVVSWPYWQEALGGDPAAVGSEIRVDGRAYTVVGVAPAGFTGKAVPGVQADLWVPYHMYPHLAPGQPGKGNLGITARVRDGVPMERAVAAVEAMSARIDAQRKAEGRTDDYVLRAFPWDDMILDPDLDGTLLGMAGLLLGVVGLVLLVACVNLAGFLLARSTARRREVAVRRAMGAGRWAIVRQFMAEAVVLGVAGGALGLALGLWTARALLAIEPPIALPLALEVGLDGPVLLATVGASVVAILIFGLVPALRTAAQPVSGVLRDEGDAGTGSRGGARLRTVLVGAQMALSVVLLVGAGLFLRSLHAATSMDPGFDTGAAALVDVRGPPGAGEDGGEPVAWLERALAEIEAEPAVHGVAAVTRLPLGRGTWVRFWDVPGVAPPPGRDDHRLEYAAVSPSYFEVMDIALLEGRGFTDADRADAPPVAVVGAALARRLWPGEPAVGRTLLPTSDPGRPVTVVGVVEDVRVWSLTEAPHPYLYLPFAQAPATSVTVVARGTEAPETLGRIVVAGLRARDAELSIPSVRDMDRHLALVLFLPRMAALLVGSLALLALVMAAVGLWGVVAYGVEARTREMGIRYSLGARRADVVGMVVRRGLVVAGAGAAVGIGASLGVARLLEAFLVGVDPWDPVTLLGVPLVLLVVAALAAWLPARRAARVDPVEALRRL